MAHVSGRDRNARCPDCLQKIKRCTCRASDAEWSPLRRIGLVVVTIVAIAVLVTFTMCDHTGLSTDAQSHTERYKVMVAQYFARMRPQDTWWLLTPPQFSDEKVMRENEERMFATTETLEQDIARCRDVNDETRRIAGTFPKLGVTVLHHGMSQMLLPPGVDDPTAFIESLERTIELCYVPVDQLSSPFVQPTFAWYHDEWHAVMMRGIEVPQTIRSAFVYHELGHALAHRQGEAGATAPPMSDAWVDEEVRMHDTVETPVLNFLTDGAYSALVVEIAARASASATTLEIAECITTNDLVRMEAMLEMATVGPDTAGAMIAQLLIAVACRHADLHASDRIRAKVGHYRSLFNDALH